MAPAPGRKKPGRSADGSARAGIGVGVRSEPELFLRLNRPDQKLKVGMKYRNMPFSVFLDPLASTAVGTPGDRWDAAGSR